MSRDITVEVPDNVYQALVQRSAALKKQPEQIAAEVLADSLSDPLLQLAGSLASDDADVGDAHDTEFGAQE